MRLFTALGIAGLLVAGDALAVPLPSCGKAAVTVVDDFSGDTLDMNRWSLSDSAGFFSLSGGHLRFDGTSNAAARLYSRAPFPPGLFILDFEDYQSTNHSQGGQYAGSYGALGLGFRDNYVRVMRGDVRNSPYFEANHVQEGKYSVWYVVNPARRGRLAIYYDGVSAMMFANDEPENDEAWRQIGPALAPGWSAEPSLMILGYPGATGVTRFVIRRVSAMACRPPIPPDSP